MDDEQSNDGWKEGRMDGRIFGCKMGNEKLVGGLKDKKVGGWMGERMEVLNNKSSIY